MRIDTIESPPITPQQYEVLHGGGAEAAEIAGQRLSRRRFLHRSMLAVWGLSTTASVAGAFYLPYPNLAGQFGSDLTVRLFHCENGCTVSEDRFPVCLRQPCALTA